MLTADPLPVLPVLPFPADPVVQAPDDVVLKAALEPIVIVWVCAPASCVGL